jgi:pyruvate,water dikinase
LSQLPEVATDIMLNVASPGLAFQFSHLPNKGVGLAREEFIINNYIGIHPLALMNHRSLMMPLFLKKLNTKLRAIQMRKHSLSKS